MAGFIYIMSNPSFADGRIKIGKSDRDPEEFRKFELETTGVPEPFVVEYYAFVENHHDVEKLLHKSFELQRPNSQREFFAVPVVDVVDVLRSEARIIFEKINFIRDKGIATREASEGETASPVMNGLNELTLPSGDRFVGNFLDGQFEGRGVLTYSGGDAYDGEFSKGDKKGSGVFTRANGDRYAGEFDGALFKGQFTIQSSRASFEGHGKLTSVDFEGWGYCTYSNGDQYIGHVLDGKRHGRGTLTMHNGEAYTGEFQDDLFHGWGRYEFSDGRRYEGRFSNGEINEGTVVLKNGVVRSITSWSQCRS
jgi:hypothetical protein